MQIIGGNSNGLKDAAEQIGAYWKKELDLFFITSKGNLRDSVVCIKDSIMLLVSLWGLSNHQGGKLKFWGGGFS